MRNTLQPAAVCLQQSVNVMEQLVHEEIHKQLKSLSPALREFINPVEVATYALNRLPALYACSEKGKAQQTLVARKEYSEKIQGTVRQALIAVQRDPLRASVPLVSEINHNYQQAETALKDLQKFLEERDLTDYQKVSWDNLVSIVQKAISRANYVPLYEEDNGPKKIYWL